MVNASTDAALNRSVQEQPKFEAFPQAPLTFQLATVADTIPPWGSDWRGRDIELRQFWPTEPVLASTVYAIVTRNAAFDWTLEGPPRTVNVSQRIFHEADLGKGWIPFMQKILVDLFTQDNGAFIEIIRATQSADSPVVGIAHLDSGRCVRTGMPDFPVLYFDRLGARHKLAQHQVISWAEFPSPVETMNGVGLCAVSRVLRAAQLARDISIYMREKASGANPHNIYLASGIKAGDISDALEQHRIAQAQKGLTRFILPLVVATLDPTAAVSLETIDLASLPESFDLDVQMRWYINQLALGFGADYQDLAPLPGRGIGTGTEALVLHMKSRGKGPALFMKTVEHLFNFHGVIPNTVTFRYDEQDAAADMESAELQKLKAERDEILIRSLVLTPEAVRQQMLDDGEMSQETFDALQVGPDTTDDIVADDNVRTPERGQQQPGDQRAAQEQGQQAKAKENEGITEVADFADSERLALEAEMAAAMQRGFTATLRDVRRRVLAQKEASWFGLGAAQKEEPADVPTLPEDVTFWQEFRTRMVGEMLPFVRDVPMAAAAYTAELGLAVNMDRVNEQVLEFSRTYVNTWWNEIETTTRNSMRSAIVSWQQTGLGSQGLPDLVDALEPLFGRARAQRIAVTEVTSLFAQGNKLAYISAGLDTVEFQTSKDDLVCPICRPYSGRRFLVGEAPTPALHVNCRCALLPVANGDALLGKSLTRKASPLTSDPVLVPPVQTTRNGGNLVTEKLVERDHEGRIARIVETAHIEQGPY